MSGRILTAIGIMTFIVGIMTWMPARIVYDLVARPLGVQADLVSGTVWNASAYRVQMRDQSFSEIRSRLNLKSLLGSTVASDFEVRDPSGHIFGTARLTFNTIELQSVRYRFDLRRISDELSAGLPGQALITGEIESLKFSDGQCLAVSGGARSTMLVDFGQRYDLVLPELQGRFQCVDNALLMVIDGQSDRIGVDGSVRMSGQGYRWTLTARSGQSEIIPVLLALGFEESGDVWRLDGEGEW